MARSCSTFSIITTDAVEVWAKARLAILNGGGTITGDSYGGGFAGDSPLGRIEGRYYRAVDGFRVHIALNAGIRGPAGDTEC